MNFHTLNHLGDSCGVGVGVCRSADCGIRPVLLLGAAWKRANGFAADPPRAGPKDF